MISQCRACGWRNICARLLPIGRVSATDTSKAEALDMDLGHLRVVKPSIGGGFGKKQDVILEPMVAFLTRTFDGIPVRLKFDREECMIGTKVRHPFDVRVQVGLDKEGTIKGIDLDAVSNTGAYASHGHSIVSAGAATSHYVYRRAVYGRKSGTIYSNRPSGGACGPVVRRRSPLALRVSWRRRRAFWGSIPPSSG